MVHLNSRTGSKRQPYQGIRVRRQAGRARLNCLLEAQLPWTRFHPAQQFALREITRTQLIRSRWGAIRKLTPSVKFNNFFTVKSILCFLSDLQDITVVIWVHNVVTGWKVTQFRSDRLNALPLPVMTQKQRWKEFCISLHTFKTENLSGYMSVNDVLTCKAHSKDCLLLLKTVLLL